MTMSLGLLLISTLALSCLSTSIFKQQYEALSSTIHPDNEVFHFRRRNGLEPTSNQQWPASFLRLHPHMTYAKFMLFHTETKRS